MKLLDTTIRDGSYAVDFKFTCDDVANIAEKSEKLGFQYIEIGHGQGLLQVRRNMGYHFIRTRSICRQH